MPRSAVAVSLPTHEFEAVSHELAEAGYDAIHVSNAAEFEAKLKSRDDIRLAILDGENDFDGTLEMYALLHEGTRDIPALLLMPPRSLGRMGLGTGGRDEFFSRPYSAESLRWRVEAILIRVENVPGEPLISGTEPEAATSDGGSNGSGKAAGNGSNGNGHATPADATAAVPVLESTTEVASARATTPESTGGGAQKAEPEGPRQGRIVIVFNPKGGVGKTTISINLGTLLQMRKQQRVLIVDCDTITGHIASSLGLERPRTLANAWQEADKAGRAETLAQVAATHSSGVGVLVMASSPLHTEVLEPRRVTDAVTAAKDSYDWIILDMHPDYGPLNQALFELADKVLVPVTPDVPCIRAAVQFREVAIEMEIRERLAIVINRSNSGVAAADVERVVGLPAMGRIRSAGMLFVRAADQGRSAAEAFPTAKVVGDLDVLADHLLSDFNVSYQTTVGPQRNWLAESVKGFLERLTAQVS